MDNEPNECTDCEFWDSEENRCTGFECFGIDCPLLPCELKSENADE